MKKRAPKPISLLEFIEQIGTEEQCREHLFKKRFGKGFKCPRYSHEQGVKITTDVGHNRLCQQKSVAIRGSQFTNYKFRETLTKNPCSITFE